MTTTRSLSQRSRRPGRGALRLAALALGVAAGAACTTVDEPPQPVRDLRGVDPRDTRREPAPSSQRADPGMGAGAVSVPGGGTPAESETRRRAQIRLELATGFYQQGNYSQALEELRSSLSIDPSNAQAYGLLGLVYMDLRDRERAEENFQRALRLAPEDSELLNNYGWYLCQTDRPREAIAQFQAALKNPLYATPAR
ncbi:MAG TPA: tetratricopeptide repeat protein, partial [Burkholderiaceae bacterium]|nr:tetratricopeptide repeat protein [Burkholderiaceae bacterium]